MYETRGAAPQQCTKNLMKIKERKLAIQSSILYLKKILQFRENSLFSIYRDAISHLVERENCINSKQKEKNIEKKEFVRGNVCKNLPLRRP